MEFLFLTTKYPVQEGDTYMTSELAGELIRRKHKVSVLHINWNAQLGGKTLVRTGMHGETIIDVAPRAIGKPGSLRFKISKFWLSNKHAQSEMSRHLEVGEFDTTVSWTPGVSVAWPLRCAIQRGLKKHVLFVFDFFPIHHLEIGLIPLGPIYWVAKTLENRIYRQFTAIICNFPSNMEFLRRNYPLRTTTRILSTPLWSDISAPETLSREIVRKRYGLPPDHPVAIFGGQITEGRGIEQMLGAAKFAEKSQSNLIFLFVGDGRLASMVATQAAVSNNVRYIPGVNRDEYLALVSACDIGMVATVSGVSSFSFPTKTIDYLRAGLRVVAAVERGSDYLALLSKYSLGEAVNFDDAEAYFCVVEKLASITHQTDDHKANVRRCLEDVFHVRHAADKLLQAAGEPQRNKT